MKFKVATYGKFEPGTTKPASLSIAGQKALRQVQFSRMDVVFDSGCYPARITFGPFGLTRPKEARPLRFEDEILAIAFDISQDQVTFSLKNKTDGPIKLMWDQASFIDSLGTSHRVIHKGVRLIDKEQPQIPTVVPPAAQIDDLIAPADLVAFVFNRWEYGALLPKVPPRTLLGKKLAVYLPIEVSATLKNYTFEFVVTGVD